MNGALAVCLSPSSFHHAERFFFAVGSNCDDDDDDVDDDDDPCASLLLSAWRPYWSMGRILDSPLRMVEHLFRLQMFLISRFFSSFHLLSFPFS